MCNITYICAIYIGITWHLYKQTQAHHINTTIRGKKQHNLIVLQYQVEVNTPNPYETNLSVKDEISNIFIIFFL